MENIDSLVQVSQDGDICEVTINRPGDRNSINSELMSELKDFLTKIEQTKTRAIVFKGSGKEYFIGGADGIEMAQGDPEEAASFSMRIQGLFKRMEESPLILVAAIEGLCFGGGYEFSLACDFRIATENSRIGLPEVKVGIIPGGGGTQRLSRLVGMGLAMEMILSGRLYTGNEAREMGLIHRVTSKENLDKEVRDFLAPVFKNPQYALSQAKRAVKAYQNFGLEEGLKKESEAFSECFRYDFFRKLMVKQLKEGILQTTANVDRILTPK
ncbi:enoyl-CoA hydratase/isomerase family protein [bacterium]|nr:enoyl-CoA hydratase/isomerase family protein [bacterium]